MAYIRPIERSSRNLITPEIYNSDIVGNMPFCAPKIFTAEGQLLTATAADTPALVAPGADGKVLLSNWVGENPMQFHKLAHPYSFCQRSSDASYSAGETRIDWDSIVSDDDSCITTGASWLYTVKQDGIYFINSYATIYDNATGTGNYAFIVLYLNGAAYMNYSYATSSSQSRQYHYVWICTYNWYDEGDEFYTTIKLSKAGTLLYANGQSWLSFLKVF